jgi:hypothetical protein
LIVCTAWRRLDELIIAVVAVTNPRLAVKLAGRKRPTTTKTRTRKSRRAGKWRVRGDAVSQ